MLSRFYSKVIGPCIFTDTTVNATTYLDMFQNYTFPQLHIGGVPIFHHDGTPLRRSSLLASEVTWFSVSYFFLCSYVKCCLWLYRACAKCEGTQNNGSPQLLLLSYKMFNKHEMKSNFGWTFIMSLRESMQTFINKEVFWVVHNSHAQHCSASLLGNKL
jgi:hypothetical protein